MQHLSWSILLKKCFPVLITLFGLGGWMLYGSISASNQPTPYKLSKAERIKQVEENVGFVKFKAQGQLHTHIGERMRYFGIKGLSIAVINNYQLDWAKGYGWADEATNTPVTTNTLFQPGSISKSIHAIGIVKLMEDKKVNLFTDVNAYLTSWKFPYDSMAKGKKITLAQLLSHSAGLNIHGFGYEGYTRGDTLPSVVEILKGEKPANNTTLRLLSEPGLKYTYSGGGTMLSQLLLMDVTGQAYDEYMYTHILSPLGMPNSFFTQPPPEEKESLLATGYTRVHDGKPVQGKYPIQPQQAAAGLWTTPTDLAHMIISIQKSLAGQGQTLLSQQTAQFMLTPYQDKSSALGFFIDERNGERYFQHGAGNPGFAGKYYGSMEGGRGVVVLMNSDESPQILDEIIETVAAIYQWEGFKKPVVPVVKQVIPLSDYAAKNYQGIYRLDNAVLRVEAKQGSLWYQAQGISRKMFFSDPHSFFTLESGNEYSFYFDATQAVAGLLIKDEKGSTRKAIKINEATFTKQVWQKYVGDYTEIAGETASIIQKENDLWIQSENMATLMKIHFLSATEFFLDDSGGIFSFVWGSAGEVKGVQVYPGENDKMILTRKKE